MAKSKAKQLKLNTLQKVILGVKLKMPYGTNLNKKETDVVIKRWETESDNTEESQLSMINTAKSTERYIATLERDISNIEKTLADTTQDFKKAKSETNKKIIARRLVMAGETLDQLKASKKRLNNTVKQVKEAVQDAQLAKVMLDSRIEESKIYRTLNGGLKLVGESLSSARKQHSTTKIEFENFQTTMTALDSSISSKSNDELLQLANKYIKKIDAKSKK